MNLAIMHGWKVVSEILQQAIDVSVLRQRLWRHMRIEVAVRTFAHAPRHVDVNGQRRQPESHDVCEFCLRSKSRSDLSACARWLKRFFSSRVNSAELSLLPVGKKSGS